MEDLSNIIGFEALYYSMCKCRKGVLWKDSVASYVMNALERTHQLTRQLNDGTYTPRPPVHFKVTSPKPRDIASVCFRDRVYQRSLNDNEVYPVMARSFIRDNFACQKGKGTDAARARLREFMRRYWVKFGNDGWVAQFDVSGYYPNMRHDVAEACFKRKLRPEVFERVKTILRDQYEGDRGYNPGSQLIQIAGISVLDPLDHYIKEQLHARFYLRYMDDFLTVSCNRAYLERCYEKINEQLAKIGFTLNPKKSRIYQLSEGIEFLGFRFSLTDTGKVLMQIKSSNVKQQRRKLFRLVALSRKGIVPRERVDESYAAWRNHASKGNNFRLIQRMDAYYKSLWKGGDNGPDQSCDHGSCHGKAS